jgi:hypothetical protein
MYKLLTGIASGLNNRVLNSVVESEGNFKNSYNGDTILNNIPTLDD